MNAKISNDQTCFGEGDFWAIIASHLGSVRSTVSAAVGWERSDMAGSARYAQGMRDI